MHWVWWSLRTDVADKCPGAAAVPGEHTLRTTALCQSQWEEWEARPLVSDALGFESCFYHLAVRSLSLSVPQFPYL